MLFIVGYFSTACYILLSAPILEITDQCFKQWKWRLVIGVLFQMSWVFGRLIVTFIIYLTGSWTKVMLFLAILQLLVVFNFEEDIWNPKYIKQKENEALDKEPSFGQDIRTHKSLFLNILIASVAFFTIAYNAYGVMNSWRIISPNKKVSEHNVLMTVLALVAKIGALIVCYVARRKVLPMMALQIFSSICYFVLASVEFDSEQHLGLGMNYVVHVSSFFNTALFSLIWVIVPETFPKKYR